MKNLLPFFGKTVLFFAFSMSLTAFISPNISPQKTTSDLQYFFAEQLAVFYDAGANKFYALQYKSRPDIDLSQNLQLMDVKDTQITIIDLDNNQTHSFDLEPSSYESEPNVYGIITFWGDVYNEQFLINDTELNTDYIGQIGETSLQQTLRSFCTTASDNTACSHGGPGSVECSVEKSGSKNDVEWTLYCSVTCGSGFYACCNAN